MFRISYHLAALAILASFVSACAPKGDAQWTGNADVTWGLGKNRLVKPAPRTDAEAKSAPGGATAAPSLPEGTSAGAGGSPVALLPLAETKKSPEQPVPPGRPVEPALPAPPPPPPQDALLVLAEKARRQGDTVTAIGVYRQYLADHPRDTEAQLGLSHVLVDTEKLDEAKPIAAGLMKQFPQDERVIALMARLDIAGGDLSAAAGRLAVASARAPGNRDVLLVQGFFEDSRGNHALAQRFYRRILEAGSDDAASNNLAMSMMADGDAAAAAQVFERLMAEQAGVSETVRHNLAMAYGLLGRDFDAKVLLSKDLSPNAVESNLKFYKMLRARRIPPNQPETAAPVQVPKSAVSTWATPP